jgi:hypothetical protein
MQPIESVAAQIWHGTPIVPLMSAGATDGAFLTPAGIPTFGDPDGNRTRALNERLRVSSVYKGRHFLYEFVKVTQTRSRIRVASGTHIPLPGRFSLVTLDANFDGKRTPCEPEFGGLNRRWKTVRCGTLH